MYKCFPAQIFYGRRRVSFNNNVEVSLPVIAIIIKKRTLLIPVLCGIFLAESISSNVQVGYFKYTKKKDLEEGRRYFLMARYFTIIRKKDITESKCDPLYGFVVFYLAIVTIVNLKSAVGHEKGLVILGGGESGVGTCNFRKQKGNTGLCSRIKGKIKRIQKSS